MKDMKITCSIVEDLLPAYTEGLCSEETAAAVKAHLAECADCAALAKQMPLPDEKTDKASVPSEKKAFRKVNRKIRRSKMLNRILGGIITAAVLVLCVLSLGQIRPNGDLPNFDTVRFSIETKRLTKLLTDGKYDEYLEKVGPDIGNAFDKNAYFGGHENTDAFYTKLNAEIKARYEAAYGNTKVKSIRTRDVGPYQMIGESAAAVCGNVEVTYEDGRMLMLFYVSQDIGQYACVMSGWSDWGKVDESPETAFAMSMDYRYDLHMDDRNMRQRMLVHEGEMKDQTAHMAVFLFRDNLRETVNERIKEFYRHDGFAVTDCIYSEVRWDPEKEMTYFIATLTAKDKEGTAVMQTRIYDSYDGWLIPEPNSAEVWEQGCTPALAEALRHFFS